MKKFSKRLEAQIKRGIEEREWEAMRRNCLFLYIPGFEHKEEWLTAISRPYTVIRSMEEMENFFGPVQNKPMNNHIPRTHYQKSGLDTHD